MEEGAAHIVLPVGQDLSETRESSMNMSTYANSWALVRRKRGFWDKGSRVGYNVGAAALKTAAALLSRVNGCEGVCSQRDWFANYETVSVHVQNKGGRFFHPIGRVRGMATSGLSSSTGNMRPIFGVLAGRRPIR